MSATPQSDALARARKLALNLQNSLNSPTATGFTPAQRLQHPPLPNFIPPSPQRTPSPPSKLSTWVPSLIPECPPNLYHLLASPFYQRILAVRP